MPKEIKNYRPCFLTGNEYLSFPEILPLTGSINSINLLHLGACGLLEFRGSKGSPFLKPFLQIDGKEINLAGKLRWLYLDNWIPAFYMETDKLSLNGAVVAPPGYRGGVCVLCFRNRGEKAIRIKLGWRGSWGSFCRTVFQRQKLAVERRVFFNSWTGGLVLEARVGAPLAAVALAPSPGSVKIQEPRGRKDLFSYTAAAAFVVEAGKRKSITLYLAANLDGDGAATTLVDLKRWGSRRLFSLTRSWLQKHRIHLEVPRLNRVLNRNLFFNYFYALGRSIDTDKWVPVTSRSPRYYVSGAFWSRDALLWSFPGLLLLDKETSRQVLLEVFGRHLDRAGEHAHYINGVVLYPGFELDQLAAYFLAIKRYLDFTQDHSILRENVVKAGLKTLLNKIMERRDPVTGLFSTFLDPSDDPVKYPFLVYNNALIFCSLEFLSSLQERKLWAADDVDNPDLKALAAVLKEAIYRHGVVEGPFGPMFAWAVDGRGRFQLYDNPPGSLQLLPHYGFCREDDDIYLNTVKWIRSSYNPYFHRGEPFAETGSIHARNPWPLGAANDLLAKNEGAEEFFCRARLDNGFACETVHPAGGWATTGLAFASAAGFISYALWWRFSRKESP